MRKEANVATIQNPHIQRQSGQESLENQSNNLLGVLEQINFPEDPYKRAETIADFSTDDFIALVAVVHKAVVHEADPNPTAEKMKMKSPDGATARELMDPKDRFAYFELASSLSSELRQQLKPGKEADYLERVGNIMALSVLVAHPFEDGNGRTARVLAHLIREGVTDESKPDLALLGKNRPTEGFKITSFIPRPGDSTPTDYLRQVAAPDIPLGATSDYRNSTKELFVSPYPNHERKPDIFGVLDKIKPHIDLQEYPEVSLQELKQQRLNNNQENVEVASKYLETLFPDEDISLLSTEGTGGLIFEDTNNRVYKVARDAGHYSYKEDEMAAITLLYKEGIGPKPYALIDADVSYRRGEAGRKPKEFFNDVPIVRYNGGGKLPIIIMEKINGGSIRDNLTDEQLVSEFDRLFEIAQKHNLTFGDVQFVFDLKDHKIKIIDAGGMARVRPEMKQFLRRDTNETTDAYPDLTYEEFKTARQAQDLISHLLPRHYLPTLDELSMKIKEMGMSGAHQVLLGP